MGTYRDGDQVGRWPANFVLTDAVLDDGLAVRSQVRSGVSRREELQGMTRLVTIVKSGR